MRRAHALSAVLLALCVCSCDPRKDFTGSYEVSGVLVINGGSQTEPTEVKQLRMVILADAFDADRLYLDFDCGLNAAVGDEDTFVLETTACPSYTSDSCTYAWTYKTGNGNLKDAEGKEPTLEFTPSGIVRASCSDGASGSAHFEFKLKGVRKEDSDSSAPLPGELSREDSSPRRSALQTALERAVRSQLR